MREFHVWIRFAVFINFIEFDNSKYIPEVVAAESSLRRRLDQNNFLPLTSFFEAVYLVVMTNVLELLAALEAF